MQEITRRQLLGATALGIGGLALWGLSSTRPQPSALQLQELAAIEAVNQATQQLFLSVNVIAPQNLVNT